VYLNGVIVRGDDARFGQLLEGARAGVATLALASFGGDVKVAMEIGRLVRSRGLQTTVLAGEQCNSACFFIWAGGIARHNQAGIVGIHRPYYDAAYYAARNVQGADQLAAALYAEAEAYLVEMNVPRPIVDRLFATPSTELHVLTSAELQAVALQSPAYQ
jgi:hypothetical protein